MPTGTPFNSIIRPYRIRVDSFAASANINPEETPQLHLLTHTHSDHIDGLSAQSFGYQVICSHDAKDMLLRHEVYSERHLQALELRAETVRTYRHLRVEPITNTDGSQYYSSSRDLLRPLSLNVPTLFELDARQKVTITAFDANHCPGAVMYLVEGDKGSVLHTGDFRAEPWFLESISRNPLLQPYLSPKGKQSESNGKITNPLNKTLEAIYLDTACIFATYDVPTKESATSGLIDLMKCFPSSVYFFINSWTWGYEDILKAVAREFQAKVIAPIYLSALLSELKLELEIHVDRYKHKIYQNISDNYLGYIVTQDPASTRFHACERFDRCSHVAVDDDFEHTKATNSHGERVIYVNPVNMNVPQWEEYYDATKSSLMSGVTEINHLLVPLFRHSPLPELQQFVKLFRPKTVIPNTLDPRLVNLDWACIDSVFSSCLHPDMKQRVSPFLQRLGMNPQDRISLDIQNDEDVTLKNLVGHGASKLAEKWADNNNLMKKLSRMREHITPEENAVMDVLLGISKSKIGRLIVRPSESFAEFSGQPMENGKGKQAVSSRFEDKESDEDSDNDEDEEHARAANHFFGHSVGIDPNDKENACWPSSEASQEVEVAPTEMTPVKAQGKGDPVPGSTRKREPLTPKSSPIQPKQLPTPPARKTIIVDLRDHSKILHPEIQKPTLLTPTTSNKANAPSGRSEKSPICIGSSPDFPVRRTPLTLAVSEKSLGPKREKLVDSSNLMVNVQQNLPPQVQGSSGKDPSSENLKPSSIKRKRSSDSSLPYTPKKPRLEAGKPVRVFIRPANNQTENSSPIRPQRDTSSVLSGRSDRDKLHRQRLEMAHELSRTYSDLAKTSYEKKRSRQLARLQRKDTVLDLSEMKEPADCSTTIGKPLLLAKTVPSFEPVEDDDSGMDWNRSRMLAEAVRNDALNGRRVVLPRLQCAESQPEMSMDMDKGTGFDFHKK